jgi:hypothetical protein
LKPGARRTLAVSQNDLDLAANYLARQYAAGGAWVRLERGKITMGASLKIPGIPRPLYVNVDAALAESDAIPRIESLRVGKIPVPGSLAHRLIPRALALAFDDANIRVLSSVIKKVTISESRVAMTYEWHGDLPEKLRMVLLPAEEQRRLQIYQERLAGVSRALKTKTVSLMELLTALFTLAAERSNNDNAVAENRAVILLLTFYVNGQRLSAVSPDARSWPQPVFHGVLLNGRDDFPKHFMVSAALAAKAGGPLSDAVGVYKELDDARRGSGFSFNDIAADRAGTRFGDAAANPALARRLQQRLRAPIRERDLMPETADLPEFMPEQEFIRRFGGIDAPPYKKMMTEIGRRIAALAFYQ